jgi:high-affinity nickel-transport protein
MFLGFRHGFDYDHMVAITDVANTQTSKKQAIRLTLSYSLGHALVVISMGVSIILLGITIPQILDDFMGKAVGATLVILGIYIVYHLAKKGQKDFRAATRFTIIANSILYAYSKLESKLLRQTIHQRRVFENGYANHSSFVVGMIHGIGAESPTQIAIFVMSLGFGIILGVAALVVFVTGIIMSNIIFGIMISTGFIQSLKSYKIYKYASITSATTSIFVGSLMMMGFDFILPEILVE